MLIIPPKQDYSVNFEHGVRLPNISSYINCHRNKLF